MDVRLSVRDRVILRVLLSYGLSNLDEVNEAFTCEDDMVGDITVDGVVEDELRDHEIQGLLDMFKRL
jgi:hypothetical protein